MMGVCLGESASPLPAGQYTVQYIRTMKMKGVCLEDSTSPRPAALTAESMTRQPWLTATFANDGFATGT